VLGTTSFHVLFGLPLGLEPSTSYSSSEQTKRKTTHLQETSQRQISRNASTILATVKFSATNFTANRWTLATQPIRCTDYTVERQLVWLLVYGSADWSMGQLAGQLKLKRNLHSAKPNLCIPLPPPLPNSHWHRTVVWPDIPPEANMRPSWGKSSTQPHTVFSAVHVSLMKLGWRSPGSDGFNPHQNYPLQMEDKHKWSRRLLRRKRVAHPAERCVNPSTLALQCLNPTISYYSVATRGHTSRSQSPYLHKPAIIIMTSFATPLATPALRTNVCTDTLSCIIYKDSYIQYY